MFYGTASTPTGDPPFGMRIQRGMCSTGCPYYTCCSDDCPWREGTGQFVVVAAEREPTFPFPKAKPQPRRPFHERINRKPWERR